MRQDDDDTVLARITPHPIRRSLATGFLGVLGLLLLVIAAQTPPRDLVWLVFLVTVGLGCLGLAYILWNATARTLELTRTELREAGGRQLCRVADIHRIDRSFFAFKPAAGFSIKLRHRYPPAYAPGLWWRLWRRLMVGGATSGAEAKATAEMIALLVAEAEQG